MESTETFEYTTPVLQLKIVGAMELSKIDVKHWFQITYVVSAVNPYFSSILDIHHFKFDLSLWVSLQFALWRFSFLKPSKLEILVLFHKLSIKYQPSIRIPHMLPHLTQV